jgi:hypothetical protein
MCHSKTSGKRSCPFSFHHEPPDAEPYVRWCGRRRGVTPPPPRLLSDYWSVKLQTRSEPAEVSAPQKVRLVTVLCVERKAKLEPTVSSADPGGVTKMEYICAGTLITKRKWYVNPPV